MNLESFQQPWDFELLDSGLGMRLERWGKVILARPDPQIIWPRSLPAEEWDKAWANYEAPEGDTRGHWNLKQKPPNPWVIKWNDVSFLLKLSPFKHTGLFAEQAANWEWMLEKISNFKFQISNGTANSKLKEEKLKILNLFAYTGAATVVLAKAGCQVTHVDASKPSITWANENQALNKLPKDSVRWILDDCVKFVKREIKRGAKYDGIIMDPPAYGHSPSGKTWKFNEDLPGLLKDCEQLLSDDAKFLLINGYATNSSALALNNLLQSTMANHKGKIEFGELCLKQNFYPINDNTFSGAGRMISTGIFARWSKV